MMSSAGFELADPNFWMQLLPTRTSVLEIALRASPINSPPSHSSAPSDTRQTPPSKFCCSFHLFEAWQPVDPKTHRPHSGIFTPPRVTRPRIWPPGVKGLAILGLTQPQPQLSCTSNAAEGHALSIIHIRCRLHPCASATRSYAHPSPGILFYFRFLYFLFCASSFLCLSSLFDPRAPSPLAPLPPTSRPFF
jgi:hypothetical protein